MGNFSSDHILSYVSSMLFRRFQALLKTYDQLSTLILDTLRSELRCRTIFYLNSAMRHVSLITSFALLQADQASCRALMTRLTKLSNRIPMSSISLRNWCSAMNPWSLACLKLKDGTSYFFLYLFDLLKRNFYELFVIDMFSLDSDNSWNTF